MAASGIGRRRAAAKAEGGEQYLARRRELVKAAASVFKEKGLAGTSLDDVAREAGVDRASLYYYVGSKQELFDEVVLEALVANIEMAERIQAAEGDAQAKLEQLIQELLVSYGAYYPHLYVFLQEDATKFDGGKRRDGIDVLELYRRFERALMAIIRAGVDEGTFRSDVPPRVAAYGILGMVNWTHRWFNPDGPVGAEEVGRAFSAIATEGLKAR